MAKKICKDNCCCPCNGAALFAIGVLWLLKELSVIKTALVLPIALIVIGLLLKYCCKCK